MRDYLAQRGAEAIEVSTDAPPRAEDLAAAYSEFLPLTGGDRVAAATLAAAAILADAVQRRAPE